MGRYSGILMESIGHPVQTKNELRSRSSKCTYIFCVFLASLPGDQKGVPELVGDIFMDTMKTVVREPETQDQTSRSTFIGFGVVSGRSPKDFLERQVGASLGLLLGTLANAFA